MLLWKNWNACRYEERLVEREQIVVQAKEWLSNFQHAQLRSDPFTSSNVNSSSSHPRVGPDKKIEVEFDAANAIEALNNPDVDLSMEGPVFDEIRILKREFEEVRWRKIPKCSNQVAHILEAAKFDGIKFWKEVWPPWLNST
ncbi:hypothetical protein ACLB2K_037380 [Fragaria x ananassa]